MFLASSFGVTDFDYVMSLTKWEFELMIDGLRMRELQDARNQINLAKLISHGFTNKPQWNKMQHELELEVMNLLYGENYVQQRVVTEAELNRELTRVMNNSTDLTHTFKEIEG